MIGFHNARFIRTNFGYGDPVRWWNGGDSVLCSEAHFEPIDAYLETKGENLATHEDIMKLVDKIRLLSKSGSPLALTVRSFEISFHLGNRYGSKSTVCSSTFLHFD